MKRAICLILSMVLMGSLFACHYSESGDLLEPVEFFFPRRSDSFTYGAEDGVLGAELREASGHRDDLNYLLTMYLRGPQDAHLRSPIPAGCRLEEVRQGGNSIWLVLSAEFTTLENLELTLACASLAKTCLSLTDAQRVRIDSSSESKTLSITLDVNSLLLADCSTFETQLITEESD